MAGNGSAVASVEVVRGAGSRRLPMTDTSVAGHRRGSGGRPSRLRSVRTQLLAPIVVATVGLAVLGTVQTTAAVAAANDAGRAEVLATTATGAVRVVHEVEREFTETVALRQRGGKSGLALVTAQRQRTDTAVDRFLRVDAAAARKAAPALGDVLARAAGALDRLSEAREGALVGTPPGAASDPLYRRISDALLAVADALPAQVADTELANAARAVAAVGAVEHFAAIERDQLRTIFGRGSLQPGDLAAVSEVVGAREQRTAEFQRAATPAEAAMYANVVRGTDVDDATRFSEAARAADRTPAGLKVDPEAWYTAQSNLIRRVDLLGLQLSDRLDRRAAELAVDASRRAWGTALGTAGIGLVALLTAIGLAVRTSRRLRRLRQAALTVARRELPDAIMSASTGARYGGAADRGPSAAAVTRSIAAASDEIGQVADAFATVHRAALRLAGEQAELRVDVARMAEVLARRIRTLITRQLRLLDEFERDETDPDALARLFALDHLAARLRRNGENLLVLAGGEPGRPVTGAFALTAVVNAAASEIEEFQRVEATVTDVAIAGPVVGDIVHLLAELLENAAMFSPPPTPVRVDARRTVDGAVVRVHDSGIGVAPNRLAEINARLAQPTMLTSAAAGTMGLYVVAHLAARHGIQVQLHSTGNGTVAQVVLPRSVIAAAGAIVAGVPGYAEPGSAAQRALAAADAMRTEATRRGSLVGVGGRLDQLARAARAADDQPGYAPWFRPYLSSAAVPGTRASTARGADTLAASYSASWAASAGFSAGAFVGTSQGQTWDAVDATSANLPRRRPGGRPAPAPAAPAGPPGAIDPDLVRARLSAFAEGVSAALRRSTTAPAPKDR
jgi:signal transduction histidine kinase